MSDISDIKKRLPNDAIGELQRANNKRILQLEIDEMVAKSWIKILLSLKKSLRKW